LSRFVSHNLRRNVSSPNSADLEVLTTLVEEGKLRPVIDSRFPLAETPTALRYIEGGHARGKVVIAGLTTRPTQPARHQLERRTS
jgi:NADPH:quinone reductase-like Zn-dependent oxidoreductase